MAKEEGEFTQYLQSPQVYLQGGFSDGNDGSVSGVHLRWTFNNHLGDNHLPKGDFAKNQYSFNKPNDAVKIYRSVFNEAYKICVELSNYSITYAERTNYEAPYDIVWEYDFAIGNTGYFLQIKFLNKQLLEEIFNTIYTTNSLSITQILAYYTGEVQIGIKNQLFFRSKVSVLYTGGNKLLVAGSHKDILRIESVSKLDLENPTDLNLSNRKVVDEFQELLLEADNMTYLRFKSGTHFPTAFCFYVYEDYYSREIEWTKLGDYHLEAENDEVVFNRLSNPDGDVTINGQWPKHYGSNAASGLRKVRKSSYEERWSFDGDDNIKTLVSEYIRLSNSDSRALESYDDDGASTGSMQISLLDIINVQATDFHIARMLGMGTLDTVEEEGRFMYLMEYETINTVEGIDSLSKPTKHLWMTHSIGAENTMIPLNPIIDEITYGEDAFNAISSNTTNSLTDENGYSYFGNFRIVNINRKKYDFETRVLPKFFQTNQLFSLAESALPISYGIEYKASSESSYRMPGLLVDDEFLDAGGNKEVYTILNNEQPKLFSHKEREVGKHKYATYTVNWFSRHSILSTVKETNITVFNNTDVPSPPSGLRVQLIQQEDFQLLTTAPEQLRLKDITGDKTLLRCLFDYNQQQFGNYPTANLVKFKFKDSSLLTAEGTIGTIQDLSANSVRIETDGILIQSSNPAGQKYPTVIQSDIVKYIGGTLFSSGKQFKIINITNPGNQPIITIRKIIETRIIDPDNNNQNLTTPFEIVPEVDARFTIIENNQLATNWGNNFEKTVYIEPFFTLSDVFIKIGNLSRKFSVKQIITGIKDKLILREKFDADYDSFELSFWWKVSTSSISSSGTTTLIVVPGNLTDHISQNDSIGLQGISENQGTYAVSLISFNGTNTLITINSLLSNNTNCFLFYKWSKTLASTNTDENSFTISGKLPVGAKLPHAEIKQNIEGNDLETIYGGIYQQANITAISGTPGVYKINFTSYILQNPVDTDVSWYLGSVRFKHSNQELILDVINIDTTGSNLEIIAYDPNYNASMLPLSSVWVNFFPSYRVYLEADNPAGFNEASTLPQNQDLTRETLLTAFSEDTMNVLTSKLAKPSLVNAKLISEPQIPQLPTGPTIANRPDSKGKSSYTLELPVSIIPRKPYAFIFYRTNHLAILNQLYSPTTVNVILAEIETYSYVDQVDRFNLAWEDLINLNIHSGNFINQPVGDRFFQFPLPDNDKYTIEDENNIPFFPFASSSFNLDSNLSINGAQVSYIDIVRNAIQEAFIPLTAQPLVYDQLKLDTVSTPSNTTPVFEDPSGNLLAFSDSRFNPSPMAVRKSSDNNLVFVDFTIDGASQNLWFYCAREMNTNLKMSDASPIQGPIFVPNTLAAAAPIVKRTLIDIDPLNPKVSIEVEPYSPDERILSFQLFRAKIGLEPPFIESDFEQLAIVELEDGKLYDDFSDLAEIPFSELLYYRVFALRDVVDESSSIKKSYSLGSNLVMTSIPNMNNPVSPELTINFTTSANAPKLIDSLEFLWNKSVYKGSYYLYKMTNSGTWSKVFELKNTNDSNFSIAKDSTKLVDVDLFKEDADGNELFHRFKIDVENSDGLMNLEEKVVTI